MDLETALIVLSQKTAQATHQKLQDNYLLMLSQLRNETSSSEVKCASAKVKRDQAMMTPIQTVPDDNAVINTIRTNNVTRVALAGVSIVALTIDGKG